MDVRYDRAMDLYELLGVSPDASEADIETAWKDKRRTAHPDAGGNTEHFQALQEAYRILSSISDRRLYDQEREEYYIRLEEEYAKTVPPSLRMSASRVDFGTVVVRGSVRRRRVLLYNDGGDGDFEVIPTSGSFWSIEGGASDDADAELIVSFVPSASIAPGAYEETAVVQLVSELGVSAQKLTIQVQLEKAPGAKTSGRPSTGAKSGSSGRPSSGPRAGTAGAKSRTTPPPKPPPKVARCPTCKSTLDPSGFCMHCYRYGVGKRIAIGASIVATLFVLIGLIGLLTNDGDDPAVTDSTPITEPAPEAAPVEATSPPTTKKPKPKKPPVQQAPWPTSADDYGSNAFWAYMGASFFAPDWVSCVPKYCLAGEGSTIHIYRMSPLEEVGTIQATGNPYNKLVGVGFTPAEAKALLKA